MVRNINQIAWKDWKQCSFRDNDTCILLNYKMVDTSGKQNNIKL